jgi:hypothetical protein
MRDAALARVSPRDELASRAESVTHAFAGFVLRANEVADGSCDASNGGINAASSAGIHLILYS